MRRIIFENRSTGEIWINHKQNYLGYKNSDEEPEWIMEWARWAVATKSLVRAHYTANKDTVYFEAENGVKHDWTTLYKDWIRQKQPESFDNWLKKGAPKDPSVPKPKPTLRQFLRVIPQKFLCKPKRIRQDACNGCEKLQVLIREAESDQQRAEYKRLWDAHLTRAKFMYQINTHWKKLSVKSFENIIVRRGTPAMEHPNTVVHYEFDYDLDHPEIFHVLNMVYFKRKITMKSLNLVQHPPDAHGSRKVFAWSGMVGGKQTEETIQCLEYCFKSRSIGAERCVLNCDGALLTYNLLQFAAFSCLPQNPNRYFKSVHVLSPETGHSRLEADSINQQTSTHYKKKEHWSTTAERVAYINEHTNVEMKEFKYFAELPTLYKQIFLKEWVDEIGNGALIRDDKGISYEFVQSQEWDENQQAFVWVDHPNEMWIRCDENAKKPVRKLKILRDDVKDLDASVWQMLRRDRKACPPIKRVTLNDTLEIVNFFEQKEKLARYYTPLEIDESGEIKQVQCNHNYGKIVTKLRRREQMNEMHRTGKHVELEPYERKQGADSEPCQVSIQIQIYDVGNSTGKELKKELSRHGISGSGKKKDLQTRYKAHLESDHGEDCSKERVCVQNVAVGWDAIDSTTLKDLRPELRLHGESKKGNRAQVVSTWKLHLHRYHPGLQESNRCSGAEEDSEEETDDYDSDEDEFESDPDPEQSGVTGMCLDEESESETDSSSGVID